MVLAKSSRFFADKQALVPFADDGEKAQIVLERIQREQSILGDNFAEIDNRRSNWARDLREARYQDWVARQK